MKKKIVIKVNKVGQIRAYSNFNDTDLQQKCFERILKSPKYVKLNRRTRFSRAFKKGLANFFKRLAFVCKTIHIGFTKPETERRRYAEKIRGRVL